MKKTTPFNRYKYELIYFLFILLFTYKANAQEIDTAFYIDLSQTKYTHDTLTRVVTIKTKQVTRSNFFSINCEGINCMPGGNTIGFYNHNNPEVGDIFIPFEESLSREKFMKIHFTPFAGMTTYLVKGYNARSKNTKIYFVDRIKHKYYLYNVKLILDWSLE